MKTRIMLIGICLCGLLATGWSQVSTSTVTPGIPGYLDPLTGSFKPMPVVPDVGTDRLHTFSRTQFSLTPQNQATLSAVR